jgi:hypothetical protein
MDYGDHYILDNDSTGNTTLVILTSEKTTIIYDQCPPVSETTSHICLGEGWVLEIYIYELLDTF